MLNVCAEDVGEPGVDEEFGRGIVSVVCDTVQNREVGVVADSMKMYNASPVLTQMTGNYVATRPVPQSLSALPELSPVRFRPFYAIRGHDLRTVTGHLGGQFSVKRTDLFVSGGADYAPLGVRSSLLYAARTPFMELGARRVLFSRSAHTRFLFSAPTDTVTGTVSPLMWDTQGSDTNGCSRLRLFPCRPVINWRRVLSASQDTVRQEPV